MNKAENIKTALITGAARRIGRQISLDLAGDGWDVIVHYAGSEDGADDLVKQIVANGGTAYGLAGDLADAGVIENLVDDAVKLAGPLSLLVNNASRFERDDVHDMTIAGWDLHLDINLRAPAFLAQKFAAQLPENATGNIVNPPIIKTIQRLNNMQNCIGYVRCICGTSCLIINNIQLIACFSKSEHGFYEIIAEWAVNP